MIQLVKLWTKQVNQKAALRKMLKGIHFSFQLTIEKKTVTIKIENGLVHVEETSQHRPQDKRLEGNEELFLSIIYGERKLREVVENNEMKTTFSIRELLLVESLFYLGKPDLLSC